MTAKFSIFLALGVFCLAFLMTITSRAEALNSAFMSTSEIVKALQAPRAPASVYDFSGLKGNVDLRANDSPVVSQFGGTCSAFAVSAVMDNLAKAMGSAKTVSERYLWSLYGRYSMDVAIETATKNYLTEETYWPVDQTKPQTGYQDHLAFKINGMTSHDDKVTEVLRALDQNHPVVMAFQVPKSFTYCEATINANSRRGRGQHVVAVVGYHLDSSVSGGGYLILKNSWGTDCGDKGYHYYPFSLCSRSDLYCDFREISSIEVRN